MYRSLLVLAALACAVGLTTFGLSGKRAPGSGPANSPEEVAYKRAHLAAVLSELSARPAGHLDAAQRERRAAVLAALQGYSDRGRFPLNTEKPSFAIPYFIDAYGTRCALAYAVDRAGDGELVTALSRADNHAFVSNLSGNAALNDWLSENGITIEEAAFIQGPGLTPPGGGSGSGGPTPPTEEPVDETPPPEQEPVEPEDRGVDNSTPASPTDGGEPVSGPTPGPRSSGFDRGNWSLWWNLNRDAFVSLRQRYNARTTTTPKLATRGDRPSAELIDTKLVPFFAKISRVKGEVKATAIMAWAMATSGGESDAAVKATLAYLRNPESRYRDLLVLALAVARHEAGTQALLEILDDSRSGRAIFGSNRSVSDTTRAFAAIALGRTGDSAVIESLLAMMRSERGDHVDLRSAAITALGELARGADEAQRAVVARYLLKQLKREKWPDPVLATIPMALIKTGDREAQDAVRTIVARFRGPRQVRESCALALGSVKEMTPRLVDALTAAARRDPDLQTRRFAAISLGELCVRANPEQVDAKLRTRLRRFYLGTLEGHFKQPNALEWHYLSAGLFVRGFPERSEKIVKRLLRVAARGRRTGERAAAILALGLANDRTALPTLRKLFADAKDVMVRGSCAEALGLLGDGSVRKELKRLALNDASDTIRYQAAIGLGYLGDKGVIQALVKELGETRSGPVRAALTRAIGQMGDRRAIDGLIAIAGDTKRPRQTRERAAGALGLIAYDSDRGWSFPVRRGFNFHYATSMMWQVLTIF